MDYIKRLNQILDITSADVVAFVPGANMVYFTGLHYHLSERPIIAFYEAGGLSFIMPQLEVTKLTQRADLNAQTFIWTDTDGYTQSFEQAVQTLELSNKTLGVDGQTMRIFELLALQEAGVDLATVKNIGKSLLDIRAIKTSDESDLIQDAIQRSEQALSNVMGHVKVGMTEREIVTLLKDELVNAEVSGLSFDPIVLTGEKSALPHGNPSDRVLNDGEFLLIDFGGMVDGYPADITRTFCIGTPTEKMREIYDAVYRANEAARAIVAPGVTCGDVDAAARQVIEDAGFGEYFTHRTGHGLGLEVHELPQIASGVTDKLQAGMVFTIEPGIYIPELGGVRIEDNILVTSDGSISMTTYSRELE